METQHKVRLLNHGDRYFVTFTLAEMPGCCGVTIASHVKVRDKKSNRVFGLVRDRGVIPELIKEFKEILFSYDLSEIHHGHAQIDYLDGDRWRTTASLGTDNYLLRTNNILFSGIRSGGDLSHNSYELSLLMGAKVISESVNPRTGRTVYITQLKRDDEEE